MRVNWRLPFFNRREVRDILFLDFDGVLHPVSGVCREFAQAPLLLPLFIENPCLRIVVTSDWRFGYEDVELQRKLGVIGPYFIGSTPRITALEERHFFPGEPDIPFSRQREILWYLNTHPEVRRWLAVDDIPDLFEETFRAAHVHITDAHRGLQDSDIARLRVRLGADQACPTG